MCKVFRIQSALHMLRYAIPVLLLHIHMGLSGAVRTRTEVLDILKF